jgi:signal transduction histidine kinase
VRRLPHTVVLIFAVVIAGTGPNLLATEYHLSFANGMVLGLGQAASIPLALRRPVAGWWLSLLFGVITGLTTVDKLSSPNVVWPWPVPGLLTHAVILLLLSLRVTLRTSVAALVLTLTATALMFPATAGRNHASVPVAVTLFIAVVVVGSALRGRREARTLLVEQEVLTAEERAHRSLAEERNRIARELHDVVAHHMSVISIQSQVAVHLVPDPSDELKENLAGIRQNALDALTELRHVLGVLRSEEGPPKAPQPTLQRLDALVDGVRSAGIEVDVTVTGLRVPLPSAVELTAFRIVQEALSNAIRHAPGSSVRVRVDYGETELGVRIANSAPDKPAAPSPGAGHGLLGMTERATMLGGTVVTGPTPAGGYDVTAALPLQWKGAE